MPREGRKSMRYINLRSPEAGLPNYGDGRVARLRNRTSICKGEPASLLQTTPGPCGKPSYTQVLAREHVLSG